jgi:hypothetical protein
MMHIAAQPFHHMKRFPFFLFPIVALLSAPQTPAQIASKVVREKIAGIDVIAYQTEVENVVTFRGSLPAGDSFAPKKMSRFPRSSARCSIRARRSRTSSRSRRSWTRSAPRLISPSAA